MSKLSEPLKQFINAAHARPNTIPAPKGVSSVYEKIAREAGERKVGVKAWLCASVSSRLGLMSAEGGSCMWGCGEVVVVPLVNVADVGFDIGLDRRNDDDELPRIDVGALSIGDDGEWWEGESDGCGGVDEGGGVEVYWVQWGMFYPLP